jgi:hypothetical protein
MTAAIVNEWKNPIQKELLAQILLPPCLLGARQGPLVQEAANVGGSDAQ